MPNLHSSAKIALFGAAGRMGQEILAQAWRYSALQVAYAYDKQHAGETVGLLTIQQSPHALPIDTQVVIDFSLPDAVADHVAMAVESGIPFACGVTGLSDETMLVLVRAAGLIPVLYSPNMSAGMNVMFRLSALAAKALPHYERHIVEIHHTAKQDAPSGTAKRLASEIQDVVKAETGITALRMGEVTGEHRLILAGPGERLEITHHAESRAVFANGALRAAEWLLGKPAGLYEMKDVLGI
jgi:4-hydroxy-tetrahydrodipicolinate reductase